MPALSDVIHAVMEISGALACTLVDTESGSCLARVGREDLFSLSVIGIATAQMLRADLRLAQEQFPEETIEDWMITLGKHYRLVRIIQNPNSDRLLFLCLILDRNYANLVMARRKMAEISQEISRLQESEEQNEIARFAARLRNPASFGAPEITEKLEIAGEDDEESLPPFMRQETVLKLLGMTEEAARKVAI